VSYIGTTAGTASGLSNDLDAGDFELHRIVRSGHQTLIFLLTIGSFALGQSTKDLALFAGCYEVTSLSTKPADHETSLIPKRFQLMTIPQGSGDGFFLMRSVESETTYGPIFHIRGWKPKSSSKVEMFWGTGFGGFRGTLKGSGSRHIEGKLKEWCDHRCEYQRRTVELQIQPIGCPPEQHQRIHVSSTRIMSKGMALLCLN
jgi:hypothetical protein